MSALRIGFVCAGWAPDVGGVESHTEDLARELRRRGHEVAAICLDYGDNLEPFSTRDDSRAGVSVRRVAYRYHDHGALADVVHNPRLEETVAAWARELGPDLVHVHHLTGFGMGVLRVLEGLDVPTVMTLHDYWPLCPRGQMLDHEGRITPAPEPERCAECLASTWPHLMPSGTGRPKGPGGETLTRDAEATELRTRYALACLASARRLFTPSSAAREVYVRAGVARERIEVCANGIEVGDLKAAVAALRAPRAPGSVRLGVLGTVLPSKGVLELAEAFVEAEPEGLTLEIHGNLPSYHGDDSYVEAVRSLAQRNARVTVHGPYAREELPAILAGLDGVAAPSRWVEVFGLTVREARAAGLPVLVSDAGDLAEVAADGRAGLVVPSEDRGAWIEALRRFAADAGARARWAAEPSAPRTTRDMAAQLERAYLDVAGRSGLRGLVRRFFRA